MQSKAKKFGNILIPTSANIYIWPHVFWHKVMNHISPLYTALSLSSLMWRKTRLVKSAIFSFDFFVWNHIVSKVYKVQVYTKSTGTFDSPFTKEVEEHKCPIRSSAIGENISLFLITFMVIWSLSGSSILVDFGWSRVARVVFAWLQWLLVHLGPLGDVVDLVDEDWLRPTCKRRHGGDVLICFEIIWCILVGK